MFASASLGVLRRGAMPLRSLATSQAGLRSGNVLMTASRRASGWSTPALARGGVTRGALSAAAGGRSGVSVLARSGAAMRLGAGSPAWARAARRLSTGGPAKRATEVEAAELSQLDKLKLNAPTYAAIAGGVLVVYGVSKTVLYITNTFMSINFSTVAWVAFVTGFGSAAVCGAIFASAYRMITIRPEPVFRAALSAIKRNAEASQLLGGSIQPGKLRAYVLRTGSPGLDSKTKKLTWLRPRVQMLFQVVGARREGMVCVEGTRKLGSLRKVHVTMLTVDVIRSDGDSSLVVITGDAEKLKVRGNLRGFLQSERVKYIRQTEEDVEGEDVVTPAPGAKAL